MHFDLRYFNLQWAYWGIPYKSRKMCRYKSYHPSPMLSLPVLPHHTQEKGPSVLASEACMIWSLIIRD